MLLLSVAIGLVSTVASLRADAESLKPPSSVWTRLHESTESGRRSFRVELLWKRSDDPRVTAYNVYRSEKTGADYRLLATVKREEEQQFFSETNLQPGTTAYYFFSDTNLQPGTTAYYVVTTVDKDHNESAHSPERSVRKPKFVVRKSEQVLLIQGGKGFDLGAPGDLVVDSRGTIHVLDALSCTIKSFSPRGEYLGEIGKKGQGTGTITYPTGLGIDRNDTIYVTDRGPRSRIDIFDRTGRFLREIVAPPPGTEILNLARNKTLQPILRDVAVNSKGRIFATDNALSRLLIFEPDGTFVREVGRMGDDPGDLNYPGWLAINDKDEVHVGNGFNRRIEVFDSDGAFLRIYGSARYIIGGFNQGPAGLAFDENGNSIVADPVWWTLKEFSPQGEYLFDIGNEKAEFDREYWRPLLPIRMPVGVAYDRGAKTIIFSLNMDKAVMVRRLLE
jgi:hypothetical protein